MRDSRVVGLSPRIFPAPRGPLTRPPVCASTRPIASRSIATSVRSSRARGASCAPGSPVGSALAASPAAGRTISRDTRSRAPATSAPAQRAAPSSRATSAPSSPRREKSASTPRQRSPLTIGSAAKLRMRWVRSQGGSASPVAARLSRTTYGLRVSATSPTLRAPSGKRRKGPSILRVSPALAVRCRQRDWSGHSGRIGHSPQRSPGPLSQILDRGADADEFDRSRRPDRLAVSSSGIIALQHDPTHEISQLTKYREYRASLPSRSAPLSPERADLLQVEHAGRPPASLPARDLRPELLVEAHGAGR